MQRLRQALDLDADPSLIDPVLAAMPLPPRAGLRVPGALDGFETAVRVILGQQVTVAAARTLAQRLVAEFGAADRHALRRRWTGCFPAPPTSPRPTRRASAGWASCASAWARCRRWRARWPTGASNCIRAAPLAAHAGRAACAARHRRMDGAADRDARAGLARRLCRPPTSACSTRWARATWPRCRRRPRPGGPGAPMP